MEQEMCETGIMDLNDDCLGEICKYLGKEDKFEFALSCRRFEEIFKTHSKLEYAHFVVDSKEEESFWEKCFKVAGSLMKSIEIQKYFKIHGLIGRYCTNLERIQYWNMFIDKSFFILLKDLKLLHSLSFEACSFYDDVILSITKSLKIDDLVVKSNTMMKGKYFYRFENLKVLCLKSCFGLGWENLTRISMTELQTLELRNFNVSAKCVQELTKHCNKLTRLAFTCIQGDNQQTFEGLLSQLCNLTQLDVIDCTDTFLKALAERQSEKIESLGLRYGKKSSYGYCKVLTQYPNLKELTIAGFCNEMRDFVPLEYLEKIHLKKCHISNYTILCMLKVCPKLIYIKIQRNSASIQSTILTEVKELLINHEQYRGRVHLSLAKSEVKDDAYLLQRSEYLANKELVALDIIDSDDDESYDTNLNLYCFTDADGEQAFYDDSDGAKYGSDSSDF